MDPRSDDIGEKEGCREEAGRGEVGMSRRPRATWPERVSASAAERPTPLTLVFAMRSQNATGTRLTSACIHVVLDAREGALGTNGLLVVHRKPARQDNLPRTPRH